MGKILTNFTDQTKMVLSDDENKIVAIINCPKGENIDITEKVIQAVKDELTETCATEVTISGYHTGNEFTYEFEFDVDCLTEDLEEEIRVFRLDKTAEY